MDIFSSFRHPHSGPRPAPARPAVEALEERRVPAVISGYVFNDLNNDGLRQVGEPPIANSNLILRNAAGQQVASAVTDANGYYQFTTDGTISTAPQTRTVLASFPTAKTGWTKTVQVAQFDPSLGTLTSVQVINNTTLQAQFQLENIEDEAGQLNAGVKGGVTVSLPGVTGLTTALSASDSFNAAAYDGTIDFGGGSGQTPPQQTQSGSQSTVVTDPAVLQQFVGGGFVNVSGHARATSNVSGPGNLLALINSSAGADVQVIYTYIPSNALRPGNYSIVLTSTPPGYMDGLRSSGGVVIPGSAGANSIPVTLTNSNSGDNNFAELQAAKVSGYVYADANSNGIKDANEAGLGGVTLTLTGSTALGTIAPLTAVTAADGSYSFGSLRPGTYTVTETTQVAGFLSGMKTKGNAAPIPGSATAPDVIGGISVSAGAAAPNNNFGKIQASVLSGLVYVDVNKDGNRQANEPPIAGVTVTLTGTDYLGNAVNVSTRTNAVGLYRFNSLRPGSYTISETQPAGYVQGKNSRGTLNGTPAGTVGSSDQFFVTVGQNQVGLDYDFGEQLPAPVPQGGPTPIPPPPPTPTPDLSKTMLFTSELWKLLHGG